ncbi:MAG TPA: flagellar biosynthesis anti-sigma factor FlgM [Bryobacteraceae bacterium]|nr:flagellar biosynthesis anti-sigma factor FlgM [Bryobacteraceae bacterium]
MRINRGELTSNPEIELQLTRTSREVVDSNTSSSVAGGPDSVALNGAGDLAQLALSAGANERADRIQQLKQLVDTNQYSVDPYTLSRALIGAHMVGD